MTITNVDISRYSHQINAVPKVAANAFEGCCVASAIEFDYRGSNEI